MSSWFRDYVYIPLGGSRRSKYVGMRKHGHHDGRLGTLARRGPSSSGEHCMHCISPWNALPVGPRNCRNFPEADTPAPSSFSCSFSSLGSISVRIRSLRRKRLSRNSSI
ncbi:MAG: hypothetical protein VCD00_06325 [Candidatus Hydrogenedentota bacterium]